MGDTQEHFDRNYQVDISRLGQGLPIAREMEVQFPGIAAFLNSPRGRKMSNEGRQLLLMRVVRSVMNHRAGTITHLAYDFDFDMCAFETRRDVQPEAPVVAVPNPPTEAEAEVKPEVEEPEDGKVKAKPSEEVETTETAVEPIAVTPPPVKRRRLGQTDQYCNPSQYPSMKLRTKNDRAQWVEILKNNNGKQDVGRGVWLNIQNQKKEKAKAAKQSSP